MAGSAPGCSATASEIWQIEDDGSTDRPTSRSLTLADRLPGLGSRCEYDVEFPAFAVVGGTAGDDEGAGGGGSGGGGSGGGGGDGFIGAAGEVLELSSTEAMTISATAATATAEYAPSEDTFFSVAVAIAVPDIDEDRDGANDFSGTTFAVDFTAVAGSDEGCTSGVSTIWEVDDSGSVARQGRSAANPGVGVVLADLPEEAASRCAYDAEFAGSGSASGFAFGSAYDGVLVLASNQSFVVRATSDSIAASYIVVFFPEIDIAVPDIDEGRDGINDFAGTEFEVTFTPVAGSAAGCTAAFSETWQVDDGGVASPLETIVLMGRPAGAASRCEYDIGFPETIATAVTSGDLLLLSEDTVTVSFNSAAAVARYDNALNFFSPRLKSQCPKPTLTKTRSTIFQA